MTPADPGPPLEAVRDLKTLTRRAAERWGDGVALAFDESGEQLSFDEVERRSNAIGNALRSLGVEPGDRVAVMLRNRPEFPLTWLAIAKIGAAMVPINVFCKEVDAGYLLEHSGARLVVATAEFVPLLARIGAASRGLETIVSVDGGDAAVDLGELLRGQDETPPPGVVLPETLANVQYTSGTTGRPKGCMLSNFYWLELAREVAGRVPGLDRDDVMLTAQPFYYMDPQWILASTLYAGARLVVLDRFHPSSFWRKVREYGVTFFYCLGVMPRLLLKTPPDPADREHRLRLVMCSAIPASQHREIEERWGVPWYELFGMTECGGGTVVTPEEHDELVGSGCMGRPLANREARIVDNDGAPVARGETGELLLRGPGMMDGYFKDEAATAAAFRNGWLHTGDLARADEDDRIYFMGRTKDMIRRSGENVSALEVEETIESHPAVMLAACVPVPDEVRGEEVKAYVVLQPGATPESVPPGVLIEFCEQRLAYFKVPRYWSYRDDLPRTPSERVMKDVLTKEAADLRLGAYDRVDEVSR